VQYKARDGLEIEAVLTLPPGREARNLPIVIMPHGGPWAHDTLDYDYWAQFVASRGYAVLQPNFRGSTGYGTEFLRKGQGQMGLAMQDDVTDGLAWAVKEGLADPKRACIVGASYGGYAAMWGVAKDPDLYRCADSVAGVANLRRDVNDFGSALLAKKFRDDWQRMTPDFAAVSPINAVERIKVPLLLIHGKKDIRVDAVQSTSMASKMRGAGKPVELVILPEADHSFTREADRLTLLTSIEAFLLKHNPPDPAAPAAVAAR
jgi:dipeptidyl aminopeptidase/acylaminoacyl peptidase